MLPEKQRDELEKLFGSRELYTALKLDSAATDTVVKERCQALMERHNPDALENRGRDVAEREFIVLRQACNILLHTRQQYDEWLSAEKKREARPRTTPYAALEANRPGRNRNPFVGQDRQQRESTVQTQRGHRSRPPPSPPRQRQPRQETRPPSPPPRQPRQGTPPRQTGQVPALPAFHFQPPSQQVLPKALQFPPRTDMGGQTATVSESGWKKRADDRLQRITELEGSAGRTETEIANLRALLSARDSTIAELSTELAQQKQKAAADISERDARIAQLEATAGQVAQDVLDDCMARCNEVYSKTQESFQHILTAHAQINARLNAPDTGHRSTLTSSTPSQGRAFSPVSEMGEPKAWNDDGEQLEEKRQWTYEELEEYIEELEAEKLSLTTTNEQLHDENHQLKGEVEILREAHDAVKTDVFLYAAQLESLNIDPNTGVHHHYVQDRGRGGRGAPQKNCMVTDLTEVDKTLKRNALRKWDEWKDNGDTRVALDTIYLDYPACPGQPAPHTQHAVHLNASRVATGEALAEGFRQAEAQEAETDSVAGNASPQQRDEVDELLEAEFGAEAGRSQAPFPPLRPNLTAERIVSSYLAQPDEEELDVENSIPSPPPKRGRKGTGSGAKKKGGRK